jgi:hypothetical protein
MGDVCAHLAYPPKLGSKACTGRDKRLENDKIVTENITDKDRNITWAWGLELDCEAQTRCQLIPNF